MIMLGLKGNPLIITQLIWQSVRENPHQDPKIASMNLMRERKSRSDVCPAIRI